MTQTNAYEMAVAGCFDLAKTTATELVECTDEQAKEAFARVRELPLIHSV